MTLGTRALVIAGFAASFLIAGVIDVVAAIAGPMADPEHARGADFGYVAAFQRPGLAFLVVIGLLIYAYGSARKAINLEGWSGQARAAKVMVLLAPVAAIVVGLVLFGVVAGGVAAGASR